MQSDSVLNLHSRRTHTLPLSIQAVKSGKSFVFWFALLGSSILIATIFWGQGEFNGNLNNFSLSLIEQFGWLYSLSMSIFLLLALFLMGSRFGKLKLGPPDAVAEFSFFGWIALLFSAGMGIGLFFYGVAEPLSHQHFLVSQASGPALSQEALRAQVMGTTLFHWSLHPWACYALVGLAMAYFSYRKNLPLSFKWVLYPLLGPSLNSKWGDIIDVLVVLATLFGTIVSLGLGTLQLSSGVSYVGQIADSFSLQVAILLVLMVLATLSYLSGVKKGMQALSKLNVGLGLLLLVMIVSVSSQGALLPLLGENILAYFSVLPMHSTLLPQTHAFGADWFGDWTLFYWTWWMSYAPFVGLFIAKISRGRTIREFIAVVLVAPTLVTLLWMTIMGDGALMLDKQSQGAISQALLQNTSMALFAFFENLPFSQVFSYLGLFSIVIFFVTSADSATLVINSLTGMDKIKRPSKISLPWQRLFWVGFMVAAALLMIYQGGMASLQVLTLLIAFPIALLLLLNCVSLIKWFVFTDSRFH